MITHNRSMHPFSFTSIATLTCRHERRADQVTEPLSYYSLPVSSFCFTTSLPSFSIFFLSCILLFLYFFPPFFLSYLSFLHLYRFFHLLAFLVVFFPLPSSVSLLHILVSILSLSPSFRSYPHSVSFLLFHALSSLCCFFLFSFLTYITRKEYYSTEYRRLLYLRRSSLRICSLTSTNPFT